MKEKIKTMASFLLDQGREITRDVLEEKLQEAYNDGRHDICDEKVNETLDNILYNTLLEISQRKKKLYEKDFYVKPPEEDIIEMRAYEYLEEHLSEIIKQYKNS